MIWDVGDANPMHRRIPGEIVSRRRAPEKKKPEQLEPQEVVVDLKAAINNKPEARVRWLTKACSMVAESLASSTDLFDIVVSRKFVAGMPEKAVRKLSAVLEESMDIFSDKQQRYLASVECPIVARLTVRSGEQADGGDEGNEDGAPSSLAADTDSVLDMLEKKGGGGGASSREQPAPPAKKPPTSTTQSVLAGPPPGDRRDKDRAQPPPPAGSGSGSNSQWESVKDEWALRRVDAERKEQKQREDAKKVDKKRNALEEAATAAKTAEQAEAERIQKLQDESDALMGLAVQAPAPMIMATTEGRKGRSMSRSRSISSRTARRTARRAAEERRAKQQSHWRKQPERAPDLAGSRAIFMNKDFVEDLPHMSRPKQPGTQGTGGVIRRDSPEKERSRRDRDSRSRTRRRR